MPTKLRFISRVVRRLRQKYGQPIGLYTPLSSVTDRDTGIITRSVDQKDISRALILPATTLTKHLYDPAYMQTGSSFTVGGEFDTADRVFLLDELDVGTFDITTESWLVFNGSKYLISKIINFTDGAAILVEAKATEGETIFEINNKSHTQYLSFSEVISVEVA